MASNHSRTEVTIHGTVYTISGETDSKYIQTLANYLNSKMGELASALPNATPQKLAVLAALNIADELFQYKDLATASNTENIQEVEFRAKRLIHLLDEGIIGDIYS